MLPEQFCNRMKDMLGDEYESFLQSYNLPARRALRFNPLKITVDSSTDISNFPWKLSPVPWCKTGFYYDEEDRPGKHVLHEAGAYYIQEPSAMLPAAMLDAKPGEYVLDLCAAPGGKSTQIAGQMMGEGILIANEIIPNRSAILSENIERCGVINAIVTNEDSGHLKDIFPEFFDAIMVDSPCSGEGMFRKDENAQDQWTPENVTICAERDDEILDNADRMLSPGGRMVFSTCTFAPAENEGSILRFLQRHPNYKLVKPEMDPGLDEGVPAWGVYDAATSDIDTNDSEKSNSLPALSSTVRIWPHHTESEGHFAALLVKEGTPVPKEVRQPLGGKNKSVKEKDLELWNSFMEETLQLKADDPLAKLLSKGTYLWFGDNLYVVNENAPASKGLKFRRFGLHLGTRKKQRFEPSHALALALSADQVKRSYNVDAAENFSALRWVNGETFSASGDKGWYLITTNGCSIGWGKLAGNVMKNHYPKGLRKNLS